MLHFDGPLDQLAHAYYSQGLDTLIRLLRLVPDGKRQLVRTAWCNFLAIMADFSEDELGDVATNLERLRPRVHALLSYAEEVARKRRDGPSQAYPPGGV